jgi:protease-4
VGLVRSLERLAQNRDAKGVFVRLGESGIDWAQSEGLARMFSRLRQQGKSVVCHAHGLTNSSMWLAAKACDRIWLSPAGSVDTVGIAAQVVYLKELLDKLKISADFVSAGKYKTFAESLTRSGPSQPARESLDAVLSSMREVWLGEMSTARKGPSITSSVEHGPWTAEEARERGLVDAIGIESEAREEAKHRARAARSVAMFGPEADSGRGVDMVEVLRFISGADVRSAGRPHIAVVPAQGAIVMQGGGLFESGGISARAMSKTLKRLKRESAVRAVVLRVDSPGGSALASDLIWHDVLQLRKAKPVIVSVGGMAASGGYYIASAANRIFAQRTSIVGSIGVVGGKLSFGPALEQLGVRTETFPASPEPGAAQRAAYLSALTPWDDAMRKRVSDQVNAVYDLFVRRVAEGRKKPVSLILQSAEGRIWTGAQGAERGLVDEIGGLGPALEAARNLAGLGSDAPVVIEGPAEGLLELLLLGDDASGAEVSARWKAARAQSNPLFSVIPSELRTFFQSLEPLLHGEHAVTALPFALSVK